MKKNIETVEDLLRDASIRSVGVISDVHQGKTNTLNHIIKALRSRTENPSIWSFGLQTVFAGVQTINSVEELESITNSVVLIDEFPDMFDLDNARQLRKFEKTMRKIFHSNNVFVICGLPRNFNKRLSAMLQAVIFKQCTLTDFIQRSPVDEAIKSYSPAFGDEIQKGSTMLTMPKNIALVRDVSTKHWYPVNVPYIEEGDSKRFNSPILKWNDEQDAEIASRLNAA